MAKGGTKGPPGGGGSGGSGLLFVTGTDADEVLVGDLFFPDNETLGYEISGFGGNDVLIGGANDDRLVGNEGLDVYYGGGGDDIFVDIDPTDRTTDPAGAVSDANVALKAADISDITLTHIIDGGDDTVDRSGATVATEDAGDTVLLELTNYINLQDGVIGMIDEAGNVDPAIVTVTNVENVIAKGADHTIIGNADPNYLNGGSGDDFIDGGAGNDFLCGWNDNDTLIGGYGNDEFMGGRGSDLFLVGLGDDVILDFKAGEDSVALDDAIVGAEISVIESGSDLGLGRDNRPDTVLEISIDGTVVGSVTFVDATVDEFIFV
jgi:Ca2+-binding RTX toxin-like protein